MLLAEFGPYLKDMGAQKIQTQQEFEPQLEWWTWAKFLDQTSISIIKMISLYHTYIDFAALARVAAQSSSAT